MATQREGVRAIPQFVQDAHGDFDSVKKLLEKEPALVNSSWDWGGGDWETGLGAAAHMGRKDIAEFLLNKGARIDLFAAAMLGKLEIVQAVVNDNPAVVNEKGPHGIPLMIHAKKGGKEAAEVVKFLQVCWQFGQENELLIRRRTTSAGSPVRARRSICRCAQVGW